MRCTWTARLNAEYWLVISEEQPHGWIIQVWGPVPLQQEGRHASAEEAEAAAAEVARQHLEQQGIVLENPCPLVWCRAVHAHTPREV